MNHIIKSLLYIAMLPFLLTMSFAQEQSSIEESKKEQVSTSFEKLADEAKGLVKTPNSQQEQNKALKTKVLLGKSQSSANYNATNGTSPVSLSIDALTLTPKFNVAIGKIIVNPITQQGLELSLTSRPDLSAENSDAARDQSLAYNIGGTPFYLNIPTVVVNMVGPRVKLAAMLMGSSFVDFTGSSDISVVKQDPSFPLKKVNILTIERDNRWHQINIDYTPHNNQTSSIEYIATTESDEVYQKPFNQFRYIDASGTVFLFKYDGFEQYNAGYTNAFYRLDSATFTNGVKLTFHRKMSFPNQNDPEDRPVRRGANKLTSIEATYPDSNLGTKQMVLFTEVNYRKTKIDFLPLNQQLTLDFGNTIELEVLTSKNEKTVFTTQLWGDGIIYPNGYRQDIERPSSHAVDLITKDYDNNIIQKESYGFAAYGYDPDKLGGNYYYHPTFSNKPALSSSTLQKDFNQCFELAKLQHNDPTLACAEYYIQRTGQHKQYHNDFFGLVKHLDTDLSYITKRYNFSYGTYHSVKKAADDFISVTASYYSLGRMTQQVTGTIDDEIGFDEDKGTVFNLDDQNFLTLQLKDNKGKPFYLKNLTYTLNYYGIEDELYKPSDERSLPYRQLLQKNVNFQQPKLSYTFQFTPRNSDNKISPYSVSRSYFRYDKYGAQLTKETNIYTINPQSKQRTDLAHSLTENSYDYRYYQPENYQFVRPLKSSRLINKLAQLHNESTIGKQTESTAIRTYKALSPIKLRDRDDAHYIVIPYAANKIESVISASGREHFISRSDTVAVGQSWFTHGAPISTIDYIYDANNRGIQNTQTDKTINLITKFDIASNKAAIKVQSTVKELRHEPNSNTPRSLPSVIEYFDFFNNDKILSEDPNSGAFTHYSYNGLGQLTEQITALPNAPPLNHQQTYYDYSQYNINKNLALTVEETINGFTTSKIVYDALNRPKEKYRRNHSDAEWFKIADYNYDIVSNKVTKNEYLRSVDLSNRVYTQATKTINLTSPSGLTTVSVVDSQNGLVQTNIETRRPNPVLVSLNKEHMVYANISTDYVSNYHRDFNTVLHTGLKIIITPITGNYANTQIVIEINGNPTYVAYDKNKQISVNEKILPHIHLLNSYFYSVCNFHLGIPRCDFSSLESFFKQANRSIFEQLMQRNYNVSYLSHNYSGKPQQSISKQCADDLSLCWYQYGVNHYNNRGKLQSHESFNADTIVSPDRTVLQKKDLRTKHYTYQQQNIQKLDNIRVESSKGKQHIFKNQTKDSPLGFVYQDQEGTYSYCLDNKNACYLGKVRRFTRLGDNAQFIDYTYNPFGMLKSVTTDHHTTNYEYDENSFYQLKEQTRSNNRGVVTSKFTIDQRYLNHQIQKQTVTNTVDNALVNVNQTISLNKIDDVSYITYTSNPNKYKRLRIELSYEADPTNLLFSQAKTVKYLIDSVYQYERQSSLKVSHDKLSKRYTKISENTYRSYAQGQYIKHITTKPFGDSKFISSTIFKKNQENNVLTSTHLHNLYGKLVYKYSHFDLTVFGGDKHSKQEQYQYSYKTGALTQYDCISDKLCPYDEHGHVINQIKYTHDDSVGNLTNLTIFSPDTKTPTTVGYEYDNSTYPGQVTAINDSFGLFDEKSLKLNYDNEGRLTAIAQGGWAWSPKQFINKTYHADNSIASIIDPQNKLHSEYYYDVFKNVTQIDINNAPFASYFYTGAGSLLFHKNKQGQTVYPLTGAAVVVDKQLASKIALNLDDGGNHLGSIVDGKLTSFMVYSPFGIEKDILITLIPNANSDLAGISPYGYNQQLSIRLNEGGKALPTWQFLGNYRAYTPIIRHFTLHDNWSPLGKAGLNGYAYAGNDPINRFDPNGHMWSYKSYMSPAAMIGQAVGLFVFSALTSAVTFGMSGLVAGSIAMAITGATFINNMAMAANPSYRE